MVAQGLVIIDDKGIRFEDNGGENVSFDDKGVHIFSFDDKGVSFGNCTIFDDKGNDVFEDNVNRRNCSFFDIRSNTTHYRERNVTLEYDRRNVTTFNDASMNMINKMMILSLLTLFV
jgi:hypothetical protein